MEIDKVNLQFAKSNQSSKREHIIHSYHPYAKNNKNK